jgi:GT2 family glycosyltransferase
MCQVGPEVAVVICTYTEDRWDDTAAAIASVQCQTLSPAEIIVVVDHNARLLERLRASFPNVSVIENAGPRGLSGGKNSGIAASRSAFIAFLDDDAVAASDWLVRLADHFREPRVLGVGGAVEPVWDAARPRWFPFEFDWVVGCTYRGLPQSTAQVRNVFSGCMCIRRDVVASIGGFRDGIGRIGTTPLGCEETELCIRAQQHSPQGVFLYEPSARISHRVPKQRGGWRYFRARCYGEGLSKAFVSTAVGAKDALASERSYALRTLPRAMLRGGMDTFLRGDLSGIARSAAVAAGLSITTAGFLAGTFSQYMTKRRTQGGCPSSWRDNRPGTAGWAKLR